MKFKVLVNTIQQTHGSLYQSAVKAVNSHITLRNWLIGFYIVEYEEKGEDRAKYGKKLIETWPNKLLIDGWGFRNLQLFRQFYLIYPQIMQTLSANFKDLPIVQTQSAQFKNTQISQSLTDQIADNSIRQALPTQFSQFLISQSPTDQFGQLKKGQTPSARLIKNKPKIFGSVTQEYTAFQFGGQCPPN